MPSREILLVEDNADDAELFERILHRLRCANPLVTVSSGEQALNYLHCQGQYANRNPNQKPALILLDLKLPGMSGFDVMRRLRADDATKLIMIFVFTSSDHDRETVVNMGLGIEGYIYKGDLDIIGNEFMAQLRNAGRRWFIE